MPMPKTKLYTVDDIYSLPEGQRAELIDGIIYDQAAPSRVHQKIVSYLNRIIGNHIAETGMPCEVYPAPFAVFLTGDEYNYVEPDLTIVCGSEKLSDRGCEGAPDWVIEVVSPSSQQMDYMRKLFKYQMAGVRLYWIVDPADQTLMVYDFADDAMGRYRFDDAVPVGICDGFEIRISDGV